MDTFVVSYLIVWAAVALYVAFLGRKHNQLKRSLDSLREQVARDQQADDGKRRAA